jgi:hypothetical protein
MHINSTQNQNQKQKHGAKKNKNKDKNKNRGTEGHHATHPDTPDEATGTSSVPGASPGIHTSTSLPIGKVGC